MRSVAITLSGIVAAPIDRVFDLLTDPHRAPDWLPGCQSVRVNGSPGRKGRSEEHTSELQSRLHLVCRLLLEKKKNAPPHTRVSTDRSRRVRGLASRPRDAGVDESTTERRARRLDRRWPRPDHPSRRLTTADG